MLYLPAGCPSCRRHTTNHSAPLIIQPLPPFSPSHHSAPPTIQPLPPFSPSHHSAPPTIQPLPPFSPSHHSAPPTIQPIPPFSPSHHSAPPTTQPLPPFSPSHHSAPPTTQLPPLPNSKDTTPYTMGTVEAVHWLPRKLHVLHTSCSAMNTCTRSATSSTGVNMYVLSVCVSVCLSACRIKPSTRMWLRANYPLICLPWQTLPTSRWLPRNGTSAL